MSAAAGISSASKLLFTFLFIFLFSAIIWVNGNAVATTTSTETTAIELKGQGYILGSSDLTAWTKQRFLQFRGVPYAESPSGPLRFKAPVARKPWNDIHDATNWGRRCPEESTILKLNSTQLNEDLEDCLNLCVYTKNLYGKLPVMVYIHGGGFYNGTALDHPAHYLMEKDIVLVVPQYRIGALGFASTQTDEVPGNAGVLDMLFALQWVQDHVATFGGDPERVTIFGQSAGAAMNGALLLSPKTPKTYFQRSIMQSGSIFSDWAIIEAPKVQTTRICRALNCTQCKTDSQLDRCLMEASVPDMLRATRTERISPVLGDKFGVLPQSPAVLMKQLDKPVSVMTGFTKHDGSFLLATYYDELMKSIGRTDITVRQFIESGLQMRADPTGLTRNLQLRLFFTRELLDSTNHAKAMPSYFDVFNVAIMKSPALTLTSQLRQRNLGKIYLYSFDYEGEHTRFGYEMGNGHYPFNGGIHHSDDNIYVFSTHHLRDRDVDMSKKMVELWTSFAITGTPNAGDKVRIPPMESESGPYFHINDNITIGYDAFDEFTATMDDPENYKLIRSRISFL